MSRHGSGVEAHPSADEDQAWLETMNTPGTSEFWRRLLKDAGLGVIALVCLLSFMQWPKPWVIVIGVAVVVFVAWLSELKGRDSYLSAHNRSVVITGCDTGFGHVLALHLDRLGATVFAGCLNAEGPEAMKLKEEGSGRMHVLQMDVTSDEQVAQCVRFVINRTNGSGLWGLVNNAGLNFLGDAELTTMDQYVNQVNINQLGLVRVTKAFLPEIRRRKGRIVNVSSVKGICVLPFCAAYTMTKFAVEAFSDALRLEMNRFGVMVIIVEPSHFGGATESINMKRIGADFEKMWESMTAEQRQVYGRQYIDYRITDADASRWGGNPDVTPVIVRMTDALFSVKPRTRYLVRGGCGKIDMYACLGYIYPFVPTGSMDRWMRSYFSIAARISDNKS